MCCDKWYYDVRGLLFWKITLTKRLEMCEVALRLYEWDLSLRCRIKERAVQSEVVYLFCIYVKRNEEIIENKEIV